MADHDTRNSGIDLAKTLAIFLVVVFHLVTNGAACPKTGYGFYLGSYVKALSWCCVDLFALVSGYLGVTGHPSFRKWGRLWFQVFVTGVLMTLVSRYVFGVSISGVDRTHLILPVTSSAYWYFTAYTVLYAVMPVLNAGLRALDRRQAFGLSAAVLALICSASLGARDVYLFNRGYSPIWLIVLYVVGGIIRLHLTHLPQVRWCLAGALFFASLTTAQEIMLTRAPALAEKLSGRVLAGTYISPIVVLTAVFVLMACLQVRVVGRRAKATLGFFSATAFGVYLLHVHPMFFYGVLRDGFVGLARLGEKNTLGWGAAMLACAFVLHLSCAFVEWLRQKATGVVVSTLSTMMARLKR